MLARSRPCAGPAPKPSRSSGGRGAATTPRTCRRAGGARRWPVEPHDLARVLGSAVARERPGTAHRSTLSAATPALLPSLSGLPALRVLFPGSGGPGTAGADAVDEPTIADDSRGTTPRQIDLELAELAAGVDDGKESEHFAPLTDEDLTALGVDPDLLEGSGGFRAAIYRDEDGGYVLAFAGSDPSSHEDWGTNLQQGAGALSAQHGQAIGLAARLSHAVGPDIDVSPWDLANPVGFVVDTAIDIGRFSVDQHATPSVLDAMEASDYFGRN